MATNKLEGESCRNWRLTNWRGKVAKIGGQNWQNVTKNGHVCRESLPMLPEGIIRKCSCHLRAFRATADVTNNGKSVIASKVAIFGNL